MNKFKKIIGFLFFTIHDGLEHKKNFSITSFNFSKFNNENFLLYVLFYPLVVSRFTSINNWKHETINLNDQNQFCFFLENHSILLAL